MQNMIPPEGIVLIILGCIFLIICLIRFIYKKIKAYQKYFEEIEREIERDKEQKERKRIHNVKSKISKIKAEYMPKQLPKYRSKSHIKFDSLYINTAFNQTVEEYKNIISPFLQECSIIDNKIRSILSYESDPDDTLRYLSKKIEELQILKEQSDFLHTQIEQKRILLLYEYPDKIKCVENAFLKLQKSEKYYSKDKSDIRTWINSGIIIPDTQNVEQAGFPFWGSDCQDVIKFDTATSQLNIPTVKHSTALPYELTIFKYQYDPFVVKFHFHYYCFFSNVILVFDNEGIYVSALDPSVLQLSITKESRCIDMFNGHRNVYHKVSFHLSAKTGCEFTSNEALLAFEEVSTKYINTERDTLPDFLALMRMVDSENQVMEDILDRCKENTKNCFCQII